MTTPTSDRSDADQPRSGVRGKIDELLHGRPDDRPDADRGPDGAALRTDRLGPQGGVAETDRSVQPASVQPASVQPAAQPGPLDGTRDRDRRPDQDGRLGSDERLDKAGLDKNDRPAGDRPNQATASTQAMGDDSDGRASLVPAERVREYGTRWDAVKGAFVDEPRQAVAQADALVGELLDELERLFRDQRRDLEHGLDADETSTEDLRLALRRYRSFFDRLLTL